ncbi:MAG: glutamine--fructose-6-phosphate transaminase (isomerizing) [Planctomycetota bacterium]
MCGIVGYIGKRDARPILIEGLKRLEYRGYDSAGIALAKNDELHCVRAVGRISQLEELLEGASPEATAGIAHTRWATHGAPTEANAHPHRDCSGSLAIVHNGIIENYRQLKDQLIERGHKFTSDTDTEVIVHLIEEQLDGDFCEAVRKALLKLEGTYGLAIVSTRFPGQLVVARNGSPLVVGVGDAEYIVASDVSAIIQHTRQIVYIEDNEIAAIDELGLHTRTIDNKFVQKKIEQIHWDLAAIEKGGYDHFMQKEIHEQPESAANAMRGRIKPDTSEAVLGGLAEHHDLLKNIRRIIITSCGTSYHAGLVGECLIEEFCRIPVEVEYASEFRYRDPILEDGTVLMVISQSGETADTLAALREAARRAVPTIAVVNTVGSTIARESDCGVYLHAGPEIGVASTKAFTSQLIVLHLITLYLGRQRGISSEKGAEMIQALAAIPDHIRSILDREAEIIEIAEQYRNIENALYLGRGYNFPVALEGALKLKEISYIHAEGYPAAEMKHGPIALIDKNMPVVCIATRDSVYDKVLSNIEEVQARGGQVIAIATEGDKSIADKASRVFYVPQLPAALTPLVTVVPLQLLAYHIAIMRGCDVDKPRNLAKSVTVE